MDQGGFLACNNIIVSDCDKEMKMKRKRLNRHVNVTVCAVTTGERVLRKLAGF
jgi:hypothetical protein